MTAAEAVDAVLAVVEFTAPVGLEDVQAVAEAIRERLPSDARLEIYHRHSDVVVEVRQDKKLIVRRTKKVIP